MEQGLPLLDSDTVIKQLEQETASSHLHTITLKLNDNSLYSASNSNDHSSDEGRQKQTKF